MATLNRQGLTAFSELLQQLYSATAVPFADHLHQVLAQHFFYDLFQYEEPELTVSRSHPGNRNCVPEPSGSDTKKRLDGPNRFGTTISLADEAEPRLRIVLTRFNRDFSRSERAWIKLLKPHLGQLYRATRAVDHPTPISAPAPWERASTNRTVETSWSNVRGQSRGTKRSQTGGLRLTRALGSALTESRHSCAAALNHAGSKDQPFTASATPQVSAPSTMPPPARPASAVLERLGLTAREAEVLLWVSRGKTNDEIAIILNISSRTVGKHMEHIAGKLNVETRTSAAAIALEVMTLSSWRGPNAFVPFTRTTQQDAFLNVQV